MIQQQTVFAKQKRFFVTVAEQTKTQRKTKALNKQITNGEPGTQTAKNIIDVRDWDQEELIEERNVNVPAFSSAVEIR